MTMSGEKMSKSLGNGLLVSQLIKQWRPVELRYYLGHPALPVDDRLLRGGAQRCRARVPPHRDVRDPRPLRHWATPPDLAMLPKEFVDAMNDDFGVPAAVAVIHSSVRAGNRAIEDKNLVALDTALGEVLAMTTVLGLNPLGLGAGRIARAHRSRGCPRRERDRRNVKKPVRAKTSKRPTSFVTCWSEPVLKSRTTATGARWIAQQRWFVMPGNSSRKGAVRTTKKGPQKGSGGKPKSSLQGRGPTPPASERKGHPARPPSCLRCSPR